MTENGCLKLHVEFWRFMMELKLQTINKSLSSLKKTAIICSREVQKKCFPQKSLDDLTMETNGYDNRKSLTLPFPWVVSHSLQYLLRSDHRPYKSILSSKLQFSMPNLMCSFVSGFMFRKCFLIFLFWHHDVKLWHGNFVVQP